MTLCNSCKNKCSPNTIVNEGEDVELKVEEITECSNYVKKGKEK